MAKRKSKNSQVGGLSSGPGRMSVSIENAENGAVVQASSEGKDGRYESKTLVAPSRVRAIRIAVQHLRGLSSKPKGKKAKGKKTAMLTKPM